MTDLNAKVIADLKRELAEAKAAADAAMESMGSEIMRLHGEIEQQRTRAEAAEHELREYRDYGNPRAKLAAIRAHLAGVHVKEIAGAWRIRRMAMRLAESSFDREAIAGQAKAIQLAECALFDAAEKLLAAAREALEP